MSEHKHTKQPSTQPDQTKKHKQPKSESKQEEQATGKTKKDAPAVPMEKDVRAIPAAEWDWSKLRYGEPKLCTVPGSTTSYRRANILYQYDATHIGPAILSLSRKYCYGAQPLNVDKDGKPKKDDVGRPKKLGGYQVPIVM